MANPGAIIPLPIEATINMDYPLPEGFIIDKIEIVEGFKFVKVKVLDSKDYTYREALHKIALKMKADFYPKDVT